MTTATRKTSAATKTVTKAAKKPAAKKPVAKKAGAHLTAKPVAAELAPVAPTPEIGTDGKPLLTLAELQFLVVDALEDIKAQAISVFDTTELSDLFDRVVVCTATSNRQTRSLANSVREKVKAAGHGYVTSEGEETGEWVLVDLGDIVVHIMQAPIREYYRLEEIWGAKPVELAKAATKKAPVNKPATRKPASKATAAKKPAAKRPAAKPAGKNAKA